MDNRDASFLIQLANEFSRDQLEMLISIWSMRPAPDTPMGNAWEQGARWAWEQAEATLKALVLASCSGAGWISVDREIPPNGKRVLITWLNSAGKRRTSVGRYAAARSIEEFDEENDGTTNDYDEVADRYYAREGWHEMPVESDYYYPVTDKVTHWKPLPESPEAEQVAEAQVAFKGAQSQVLVPVEPDVALLSSMATCLNHGFGMMPADAQERQLYEMRKLHDEVVGKGYYRQTSRHRYLDWLAPSQGGSREHEPPAGVTWLTHTPVHE